ncbi:MAG: glutamyl-tRNA reductase [Desulfobacteraceae bacterium]|nr:MAG: glutamyl-tRNA reductase [Desulfobacteraceae bacterium]
MNEIVLLGLNHTTAPVALRECLAFSNQEAVESLAQLGKDPAVDELLIFSTCNRVEILMTSNNISAAVDAAKKHISTFKRIHPEEYEKALYTLQGEDAVKHVFRVASSLDSMIIGEPQILGQIKEAYRVATENKTSGVILNRLLHRTFFVAKKVRTETGIGGSAVSISYAAVELGKKIFGSLEEKKVLLIGAGEMAELAVEHIIQNRASDIYVANRTFRRAVALADRFQGKAVHFEEIQDVLKSVDIIISSTGSPSFIISHEMVKSCMKMRKNRPIFFIDIAVPRDIDPAVNRISNSYVYDIDDLKSVIDENIEERKKEAIKGERIVDEAVIKFMEWYQNLEVIPTIVSIKNKLDTIVKSELEKTRSSLKHLPEPDLKTVTRMTDSIIKKFMHDPTLFLKGNGCHGDKAFYLDAARKLFKLDD